jgi:hypothetical protein
MGIQDVALPCAYCMGAKAERERIVAFGRAEAEKWDNGYEEPLDLFLDAIEKGTKQ